MPRKYIARVVLSPDRSKIGKPYILDYAKIGTGPTFVQRVISLILLTSDFSFDLMQGSVQPKEIRVLKAWGEAKTTTISRIAQKFLECRRCSPSEKRSLGVHRDRSIRWIQRIFNFLRKHNLSIDKRLISS